MNSTSRTRTTDDLYASWVAMWRRAIEVSPLAIGLVQLSTTRFLEISEAAAELLRTTRHSGAGLDYLAVTERPREALQMFRLVGEGMLDGIRGRRRFHRADGSTVELQLTGWAIRSAWGPDLGLWLASDGSPGEHPAAGVESITGVSAGSDVDRADIRVDYLWRLADMAGNGREVFGRRPDDLLPVSLLDLTHRDDVAALLFAFARATTDVTARARVRLRHGDGSWRALLAEVTRVDGDSALPFSLVATPLVEPPGLEPAGASQVAEHLRRIATQIEAAGVLAPLIETAAALGVPPTAGLSPRQWEITRRLVQGQRVAGIAAEMYLSQGTVRNHLSLVFQKFGVHSQVELLALLRMRNHAGHPAG